MLERGNQPLCCRAFSLSTRLSTDTAGYRFLSKSLSPSSSLPRNLQPEALRKGEGAAVTIPSPAPEILALLRECGGKMERSGSQLLPQ